MFTTDCVVCAGLVPVLAVPQLLAGQYPLHCFCQYSNQCYGERRQGETKENSSVGSAKHISNTGGSSDINPCFYLHLCGCRCICPPGRCCPAPPSALVFKPPVPSKPYLRTPPWPQETQPSSAKVSTYQAFCFPTYVQDGEMFCWIGITQLRIVELSMQLLSAFLPCVV